ncbi:MAG: YggT family protein [Rhodovibrionaceae bacterium]
MVSPVRLVKIAAAALAAAAGLLRDGRAGIAVAEEKQGVRAPMYAIISLISMIIDIYIWLLIAMAVLSWLVAFNVINTTNRFVYTLGDFLHRITEPALRPLRRIVPNLGGIDVSPVILILLLIFIQNLLVRDLAPALLQ